MSDAYRAANNHPTEFLYSLRVLLFHNVPIFLRDLFHLSTEFSHRLKLEALREGDSQNSAGQGPERLAAADPALRNLQVPSSLGDSVIPWNAVPASFHEVIPKMVLILD